MTILGGTLGQIFMPVICLGTFLVKTRDPFGASVALWWTAESMMDIAPYINDGRAMDLMLIGGVTGKETDGHDWNNILTMLDLLEWDHRLAHLTYNVGTLFMLTSFSGEASFCYGTIAGCPPNAPRDITVLFPTIFTPSLGRSDSSAVRGQRRIGAPMVPISSLQL